jgi:hypothetical protein
MVFRVLSVARLTLGFLAALFVVSPLAPSPLTAQQDTSLPPPDNLPTETLHVYTNRMQFPTLLIDKQEHPIAHTKLKDFDITLDSGKSFHPSGMHIEGDDPLAIAVLLDLSGSERNILNELPTALDALVPQWLHPQDRLYFYALDCRLIGLPAAVPVDAAAIRSGLASISNAPVHSRNEAQACPEHPRLWDAIGSVSHDLAKLPARHVLLVISRGRSHDSVTTRAAMNEAINFDGVTVFGIRDILEYFADHGIQTGVTGEVRRASRNPTFELNGEDRMLELSLRSGGFILDLIPGTLTERLRELIDLLRGRYVLEFARPDKNFVGWHAMEVKVPGVPFVLATGTSAPVADNSILQAPDTVPVKPSPAVVGDRNVLPPENGPKNP